MDIPLADLAIPGGIAAGGWALAFYFARLVFTGALVPRSVHEEQKEAAREWRKAADRWRDAFLVERGIRTGRGPVITEDDH